MILLTVGTQLPFDRLVRIVDDIASRLDEPVEAQIGRSTYTPQNMRWECEIDPIAFEARIASARVVVAHAGIGTIVTAQRQGRPLILFPRLANLAEHRNDHQLATAAALANREGIYVARSAGELDALLRSPFETVPDRSDLSLPTRLQAAITAFIDDGAAR